ncbi:hypothetical protein L6164_000420 [Bauhinia variegata]|uniref:Uncharacterized protein n=1 Tax=Bauhinia variegata TaxID=167791 RepID=A0ACB9Q6D8_BAUVA|nr:hypothetical protein L6164_000420 [Bauhinia variegata]
MAQELAIKIILILWPLLLYSPMSAQQAIWPESRCGDVVIPFPFHIKSSYNCSIDHRCKYMDDWFEIECRDNRTPFLKSMKLEVTEIDFKNNTVIVMNPIYRCQNSTTFIQSTVPLDQSPFLYPDTNKIIVFGCNTRAQFSYKSPERATCVSSCESKDDMLGYKGCFGMYCCQIDVPWHLSDFNISISRENVTDKAYNTNNPCDFVLIADQDWFFSKSWQGNVGSLLEDIKDSSFVPAVLQWGIPINSSTYSIIPTVKDCHDFSYQTVSGILLIRRVCFCSMGESGNPYTGGGCIGMYNSYKHKTT